MFLIIPTEINVAFIRFEKINLRGMVNLINVEKMNGNFIKHSIHYNRIFDPSRQNSWIDRGKTNDSFFKISQTGESRDVSPI